ncbi:MAG: ribokinase [Solirubrobacterales bacterium]
MKRASTDVIVVGSLNVDIVVRTARLPGPGETVVGPASEVHQGGKGANSAVAAARAGARTSFIGAVGEDADGSEALELLEAEGVDTSATLRLAGVRTGTAAIVVDDRGENQIAVGSGANWAMSPEKVQAALADSLPTASWLLLSLEISADAARAAVAAARAAGVPVILNPAPAGDLAAELAPRASVLTPNAGEALALTGESEPPRAAAVLAAETDCTIVLTAGADGVFLAGPGAPVRHLPALPLDEVTDTVGAGDTLNGALAARLAAGDEIEAASRFAVVAAGLSTTVRGAREGMPREADVRKAEATLPDPSVDLRS